MSDENDIERARRKRFDAAVEKLRDLMSEYTREEISDALDTLVESGFLAENPMRAPRATTP